MKKLLLFMLCIAFAGQVSLSGQEWALSSNIAQLADLGSLNADLSYGFARHWSVSVGGRYNPFSFAEEQQGNVLQHKQRTAVASVRFWPWHIYSGWWLSSGVKLMEFNRSDSGTPESMQGDRYGGGLGAGYTYMLGKHFNIELGMGLWGGYERYAVYSCAVCGRKISQGEARFLKPDDLILSLSYVF